MNKGTLAVILGSVYLLIFLIAAGFSLTVLCWILFLLAPVLIILMVYTVIRYGQFDGKELGKDEWGYGDRKKEDLGLFY